MKKVESAKKKKKKMCRSRPGHNEPFNLDLNCSPSSPWVLNIMKHG